MIYLDNAATTFPKPDCVYDRVNTVQRTIAVNVGRGSYKVAADAMKIVDETRYLLAELLGANSPGAVVFTPSATIAANEIILGLDWNAYKTVYVTPFEHNAIARPLNQICTQYGIKINILPFNPKTQQLDESEMERLFSIDQPDYVFANHVSNVTGTIIPIQTIAKKAKEYNATIVVDGSQSVGLLPIDLSSIPIDFLIFAGHKNLYSSWGVGGFIANTHIPLKPVLSGGTGSDSLNLSMSTSYPTGYESGSPNIIAIASLNEALKWLKHVDIVRIAEHKKTLVSKLISGLQQCGATLYLPASEDMHTSVVSFNVEGYTANEIGLILSEDFDIAVRTGYHCAPFIHKLLGTEDAHGTIRVSVGYFNSEDNINRFIEAVKEIMRDSL